MLTTSLLLSSCAAAAVLAFVSGAQPSQKITEEIDPAYVLHFTMDRIDGEPQELIEYEGKVVLMVNVASRCGLTGQYEPLQALYEAKKDEGFVVLGFPANDFMGQEPGSNEEIAEFCQMNFGVTFPMFAKISVKGDEKHPLYTRLSELPEPMGGEPSWNFTKYLVGRDGKVVRRFDPRTKPDDEAFVAEVERLLATEAPAD